MLEKEPKTIKQTQTNTNKNKQTQPTIYAKPNHNGNTLTHLHAHAHIHILEIRKSGDVRVPAGTSAQQACTNQRKIDNDECRHSSTQNMQILNICTFMYLYSYFANRCMIDQCLKVPRAHVICAHVSSSPSLPPQPSTPDYPLSSFFFSWDGTCGPVPGEGFKAVESRLRP